MAIGISIVGIEGRMGKKVLSCALNQPDYTIVGGIGRPTSPYVGKDVASLIEKAPIGVLIESEVEASFAKTDAIIDFSSPANARHVLTKAASYGKPLVIGSTGHDRDFFALLENASLTIPVLFSPNFSLGMAACLQAAELLYKKLENHFQVSIEETHHIHKKDAPSGTAIALAKAMQKKDFPSIEIRSTRSGEVVGEHTVRFENLFETLAITHSVTSRKSFAQGALLSAKFLVKQKPGLYSFADVLGAL